VAKAADQTTTWILLAEAVRLVADAYGYSLKSAEADVVRWLGKGRIRWRGELRGRKRDVDAGHRACAGQPRLRGDLSAACQAVCNTDAPAAAGRQSKLHRSPTSPRRGGR
jgi:hypothetical protein